uniref:Uncharacterized protein n=1 Tax=Anopheles albimanus TaxID=7167 RepID=A0A182FED5_ANOAL
MNVRSAETWTQQMMRVNTTTLHAPPTNRYTKIPSATAVAVAAATTARWHASLLTNDTNWGEWRVVMPRTTRCARICVNLGNDGAQNAKSGTFYTTAHTETTRSVIKEYMIATCHLLHQPA